MKCLRLHVHAASPDVLLDLASLNDALEELEVGDVARVSKHCRLVDSDHTLQVRVPRHKLQSKHANSTEHDLKKQQRQPRVFISHFSGKCVQLICR